MNEHVKDYRRNLRLRGEIINKVKGHQYTEPQKATFDIVNRVKPTHFLTIQLKQSRSIKAHNGWTTWVRGDDTIYSNAYISFIKALSKEITPRAQWEKHKEMIGNFGVISGGTRKTRNHLHLVLRKPEHVDDLKFRRIVCRLTEDNPWFMRGKFGVNNQGMDSAQSMLNTTVYSAKQGIRRMLIA